MTSKIDMPFITGVKSTYLACHYMLICQAKDVRKTMFASLRFICHSLEPLKAARLGQ